MASTLLAIIMVALCPYAVTPQDGLPPLTCASYDCLPGYTCVMVWPPCAAGPTNCPQVPQCVKVYPPPPVTCHNVDCPHGQTCIMQKVVCVTAPCYKVPVCVVLCDRCPWGCDPHTGVCVTDPCDECPSGCDTQTGICYPLPSPTPHPCELVMCPKGYICDEDGNCVQGASPTPHPCVLVMCPKGYICDEDGNCVQGPSPTPHPCKLVICPKGYICDEDGNCVQACSTGVYPSNGMCELPFHTCPPQHLCDKIDNSPGVCCPIPEGHMKGAAGHLSVTGIQGLLVVVFISMLLGW